MNKEKDQGQAVETITTKSKKECLALRWIQHATGNKDRPILSGIYKNGELVSADGFRLHVFHPADSYEEDEGVYKVGLQLEEGVSRIRGGNTIHKTPGRIYDVEKIEGTFPDFKQILPRGLPWASVTVNKKYLVDAVEDMPATAGMVSLSVWGPGHPIRLEGEDETGKATAVIMPMHDENYEGKRSEAVKVKREAQQKALDYIRKNHPDIYKEAIGGS